MLIRNSSSLLKHSIRNAFFITNLMTQKKKTTMKIISSNCFPPFSLLFLTFVLLFFCPSPFSVFSSSIKLRHPLSNSALQARFDDDNLILDRSRDALFIRKLSHEEELELGLARARAAIRKAMKVNSTSFVPADENAPKGSVYRNLNAFYQSYLEMEKRFKVYVYEEGERPMVHGGPCKDIYTSEGRFVHTMELQDGKFRTRDPQKAHVYFLPFSVAMMVKYIYKENTYDRSPLLRFVWDYVKTVSTKYPYWNRTQGADHFMLSCHDWGPASSQGDLNLYKNSIRVLCNANTSEGFNPQKDATLPEINLKTGNMAKDLLSIPSDDTPRPLLAFFAGGIHGPIRPILLQHWKGRDRDLQVYEYLPHGQKNYYSYMLKSKYCLCPSGYEVASPRVIEAIYAECIPVTISDHYVLPFSDVLRWETFSVQVQVADIPKLKEILKAIPEEKYWKLKEGVKTVKRHFMWNEPPQRFDVFHMILHSIWLRRLNIGLR